MSRNYYELSLERIGIIRPWHYELIFPNGYMIIGAAWTKRGAKRKATNLLISIIDHPAKGSKN